MGGVSHRSFSDRLEVPFVKAFMASVGLPALRSPACLYLVKVWAESPLESILRCFVYSVILWSAFPVYLLIKYKDVALYVLYIRGLNILQT